ncbi:MAG: DNA primase [Proteobacteria bacterium]|nr:DNA primase [Pseudomonadota bacterium]
MKIDKQLIKEKFNIVDYIGKYILLRKSGKNYVGLCPFHKEKTPSFTVSEEKQIFHCFGCGIGGDLIEFLSKFLNLNPFDVIRLLEKDSGLKLVQNDREYEKKEREIKRIYEINKRALSFFVHNLFKTEGGSKCLKYLNDRGLKIETIKKFLLGYAGIEWDRLFKYLEKVGYSKNDIEKSGLVVQSGGGYRDFFRHKLIFPIINRYQEVIGFGGRALDNSLPKYINTPENMVFLKRRNIFGINYAIKKIKEEKSVFIVEGYMDCIMMHQAGFDNTVATLGTALTEEHVKFLKGFAEKFYLIFDGDNAGRQAGLRACETFMNVGITPNIVLLPDGEDPDSLIKDNKVNVLLECINNSKKGIDFLIEFYKIKYSLFTADGIRGFLSDIEKHLQNITNPLEIELVYREVAKTINMTPEELVTLLNSFKTISKIKEPNIEKVLSPEDYVLAFLMRNKDFILDIDEVVLNGLSQLHKEVLESIMDESKTDTLSEKALDLYRRLSIVDIDGELSYKAFVDNLNKIKLKDIKKIKAELSKEIAEAEKAGNHEKVKLLTEKKWHLAIKEKEILQGVKK